MRVHPLIAGGAVDAGKRRQLFAFAEDFLDHDVERLAVAALRLADQAAQALEILRGIAQAVDVVEPQPLQSSFRDQSLDQPMDGLERAGVLDAQARQRIDVEEAAIVDVAGSKPPVAELVVLALQQMMQRERRRSAIGARAIGRQPARDDLGAARDRLQLRLECGRFLAVGMAQSLIAGGKRENTLAALRSPRRRRP